MKNTKYAWDQKAVARFFDLLFVLLIIFPTSPMKVEVKSLSEVKRQQFQKLFVWGEIIRSKKTGSSSKWRLRNVSVQPLSDRVTHTNRCASWVNSLAMEKKNWPGALPLSMSGRESNIALWEGSGYTTLANLNLKVLQNWIWSSSYMTALLQRNGFQVQLCELIPFFSMRVLTLHYHRINWEHFRAKNIVVCHNMNFVLKTKRITS